MTIHTAETMARTKSTKQKSKAAASALRVLRGKARVDGRRVIGQELHSSAPTPERMAKGDVSPDGNRHQSEDILDRLKRLRSLDPHADMSRRMYDAGVAYRDTVYLAGLSGIAAQDVSRACGGSGDPAYMTPASMKAVNARLRWRQAWKLMGGRIDDERRGDIARNRPGDLHDYVSLGGKVAPVVHAMLVEGKSPLEAGLERGNYLDPKYAATEALTVLRIGLWILAMGWC